MALNINKAEFVRSAVKKLRERIPGITLRSTVIVGFPGEEESDFLQTREVMNEVGFEQAFIFKYSPHPGAKSASLLDSVSEEVKLERNNILLDDLKLRIGRKLSAIS